MGPDIRERLKDAALEPSFDIDVDELHRRARRSHARNVATAAAISIVAVVAGAALVISTFGATDLVPPVLSPGDEVEQRDVDEERQAELERERDAVKERADERRREAEREAARDAVTERAATEYEWRDIEAALECEGHRESTDVDYAHPPDSSTTDPVETVRGAFADHVTERDEIQQVGVLRDRVVVRMRRDTRVVAFLFLELWDDGRYVVGGYEACARVLDSTEADG